jgi:processive 1,2-diacylglycerol beta-glucosyltransferase
MKKILILYTSVGLGHKYIAINLAYHLERAGYKVLLHDILQVQEGALVSFGVWLHSFINRRIPFVWRWLYFSKLVNYIGAPLRVPLAKSNSDNLYEIVKQFEPDCILSTQTTGSAATASLIEQKKFTRKFIIAFSDFHLHKFWLYPYVDLYLVNIEEQKQEMLELGIQADRIVVCGTTLKPQIQINRDTIKDKLGVPLENKLIIFGSGSLGIGFDFELLREYLQQIVSKDSNISVAVMCGKNETLKNKLDKLSLPNTIPLGFYDNPTELYQSADLLVTKPGGLTIAEALQSGIKILVTHTLPGQEEPNYDYLLAKKLIYSKPEPLIPETLVNKTFEVLSSPNLRETEACNQITQLGKEGEVVISAVNKMFNSEQIV